MRKSQYLVAMEVNEEDPKQIRIPYLKNKNEEMAVCLNHLIKLHRKRTAAMRITFGTKF